MLRRRWIGARSYSGEPAQESLLVVQEAMASGLPVICGLDSAAADPSAQDLIRAVDVDPADPAATARRFAAAIGGLSPAPDQRLAEYARTAYDWDENAKWLESRIREFAIVGNTQVRRYDAHESDRLMGRA